MDILVASHHGRDAGYCAEIFQYCQPKLVIVSDRGEGETSVTSAYAGHVIDGLSVKEGNGEITKRKVLTTRYDGTIKVVIDPDGRAYISVSD